VEEGEVEGEEVGLLAGEALVQHAGTELAFALEGGREDRREGGREGGKERVGSEKLYQMHLRSETLPHEDMIEELKEREREEKETRRTDAETKRRDRPRLHT